LAGRRESPGCWLGPASASCSVAWCCCWPSRRPGRFPVLLRRCRCSGRLCAAGRRRGRAPPGEPDRLAVPSHRAQRRPRGGQQRVRPLHAGGGPGRAARRGGGGVAQRLDPVAGLRAGPAGSAGVPRRPTAITALALGCLAGWRRSRGHDPGDRCRHAQRPCAIRAQRRGARWAARAGIGGERHRCRGQFPCWAGVVGAALAPSLGQRA
jgi:hypothetical protein